MEPLELLLPGEWQLIFPNAPQAMSGSGTYTFKLAGTFTAQVRDIYSGSATWHGYWEVRDAHLHLTAQEVTARCSSCLDGGSNINWVLELEQVASGAFSGVLAQEAEPPLMAVFQRVG